MSLAKDVSGKEAGDLAFLGALQVATTTLWEVLSALDKEDYLGAAKEWSEDALPKHIQSR